MTVDIEDISSLKPYLRSKNVLASDENCTIKILSGGVSNKAIILNRAHKDDWVIKQGLHKLRVDKAWYSDPKRLEIEYLAMIWLSKVLKEGTIPKPLLWDKTYYILGMEAISQPHDNLKTLLLNEEIDLTLIAEMGSNLARIHKAGRHSEEAKKTFKNQSFFNDLRMGAYYLNAAKEFKVASSFLIDLVDETLQIKETIVHGDYSPKNMLVKEGKLVLLDHEVTHYGDPMFDIGFAICHLLSKANHLPRSKDKMIEAAHVFWKSYLDTNSGKLSLEDETRGVKHSIGCLISRVKGKSPLEYLNEQEKERQLQSAFELIAKKIKDIPEFINEFSRKIEAYKNEN